MKTTNKIGVNYAYISMDKKYGQLRKPPCKMLQTIIKNDNYTMFLYKDTLNFITADTLKLTNEDEIFFNSVRATLVDSKKIAIKNQSIVVKKIYIPKIKIAVDESPGTIIYLTDSCFVAKYGTSSNYITLYKPELYTELHDKILYQKINFKRHKQEMKGYMP